MPDKHYPGETVGIIGSSIASALLAQALGQQGYRVASLVTQEVNPVRQFASWQTVVDSYTDDALRYFAGRINVAVVESGLLSNPQYQILNQLTDLPLSEDLVAITTDRLIEKAYLDSNQCLVAPFSLVTDLSDIKEAIEILGFPCVLKTTQRNVVDAHDHVILYSEEDYSLAEAKVDQGSCILESWIPVESEVSVTVVRNERGEMLIYPVFELGWDGEAAQQISYPADITDSSYREVNRLAQVLAESLDLIGPLTLRCLITEAGVIYINRASVDLIDEAVFTIGTMSMSHYEATARALVGLPLPNLRVKSQAAIALPLHQLNHDNVLTQFMLRTDWSFVLFRPIGLESDQLMGHVIVTGDSVQSCYRQLDLTELLASS